MRVVILNHNFFEDKKNDVVFEERAVVDARRRPAVKVLLGVAKMADEKAVEVYGGRTGFAFCPDDMPALVVDEVSVACAEQRAIAVDDLPEGAVIEDEPPADPAPVKVDEPVVEDDEEEGEPVVEDDEEGGE